MEGIQSRNSRSNWITTLLCASLLLPSASAGLLNRRQDDGSYTPQEAGSVSELSCKADRNYPGAIAASEAIAAASGVTRAAPSAASTILAATAPAKTAATATNTANKDAASTATTATPASNGTGIANSTIPAVAAATSDFSNPLNATNDPNECHATHMIGDLDNPFCAPSMGQTVLVGKEYEGTPPFLPIDGLAPLLILFAVTWDQSLFTPNSTNTIVLHSLLDLGVESTDKMTTLQETKAPNSQGTIFLKMISKWLNKGSTTNLTLSLRNDQANSEPYILPGPVVKLVGIDIASNTTHTTPSSKAEKLGEAVGIPMGLVFLIIAVALIAAFICMRKRRGLGYGGGKAARSQRMEAAVAPVASRGRRRAASFHDEPTRGMELQDRSKGLTGEDNWDWGSPVSSPTTGGRNSNAFRDEMQRQKSGRRS